MSNTISNRDDIIDSRDVVARMEEIESELQDIDDEQEAADLRCELEDLLALQSEAEGYAKEWSRGVTLIRDSYFKEYAQEFAEDIGAIPDNARWPATCIDWEQAANELQMDYTCVEFNGVDYWVR